jgi:hypothetical protein
MLQTISSILVYGAQPCIRLRELRCSLEVDLFQQCPEAPFNGLLVIQLSTHVLTELTTKGRYSMGQ